MNVLVAGATGQTGRRLVKEPTSRGHHAIALVRESSEQAGTDAVDRDGAKRVVDLAAKADVQRFVMLSSVGAGDPDPDSKLAHYLQVKHDADEHLKASGLTYAILRPVSLTNEDGTRDMLFGDDVDPGAKAARGDVSAVPADALDDEQWAGQVVRMQST